VVVADQSRLASTSVTASWAVPAVALDATSAPGPARLLHHLSMIATDDAEQHNR
jgi:hypothetical protein